MANKAQSYYLHTAEEKKKEQPGEEELGATTGQEASFLQMIAQKDDQGHY